MTRRHLAISLLILGIQQIGAAEPLRVSFPLEVALEEGTTVAHYRDNGGKDYMGGGYYHAHTGTDFKAFSWRDLDRGILLLAPFDATITAAGTFGVRDWHLSTSGQGDGNGAGNTLSFSPLPETGIAGRARFAHVRHRGSLVKVGEVVRRGQPIAFMGSTETMFPHLHFDSIGNAEIFSGTAVGPSPVARWEWQAPYSPSLPLRVHFLAVHLADGELQYNGGWAEVPDLHLPAVVARDATGLRLRIGWQGPPGSVATIDIVKPDGSIYRSIDRTQSQGADDGWQSSVPAFSLTGLSAADDGVWTVRARRKGETAIHRTATFRVGPATVYGPWFRVAGRCFRAELSETWPLTMTATSATPVTYSLRNAPAGVSISGANVVIAANASDQHNRLHRFYIDATAAGHTDTFSGFLIDFRKPHAFVQRRIGVQVEGLPPAETAALKPWMDSGYPKVGQWNGTIAWFDGLDAQRPARVRLDAIGARLPAWSLPPAPTTNAAPVITAGPTASNPSPVLP